jgi:hypothetical protein
MPSNVKPVKGSIYLDTARGRQQGQQGHGTNFVSGCYTF